MLALLLVASLTSTVASTGSAPAETIDAAASSGVAYLRTTAEAQELAPLLQVVVSDPSIADLLTNATTTTTLEPAVVIDDLVGAIEASKALAYTQLEVPPGVSPHTAANLQAIANSRSFQVLASSLQAMLGDTDFRAALEETVAQKYPGVAFALAAGDPFALIAMIIAFIGSVILAITGTIAIVAACVGLCVGAAVVGAVLAVVGGTYLTVKAIYDFFRADVPPAPALPSGCVVHAQTTMYHIPNHAQFSASTMNRGLLTFQSGCASVKLSGSATTTNGGPAGVSYFIQCRSDTSGGNEYCFGEAPEMPNNKAWFLTLNVVAVNLTGVTGSITVSCDIRYVVGAENGCAL